MGHLCRIWDMKYSKEHTIKLIKDFRDREGRWPTATDFDTNALLPNRKYVQRNFGGWKELQKDLRVKVAGQGKKVGTEEMKKTLIKDIETKIRKSGEVWVETNAGYVYTDSAGQWSGERQFDLKVTYKSPDLMKVYFFCVPGSSHSLITTKNKIKKMLIDMPPEIYSEDVEYYLVYVSQNLWNIEDEFLKVVSVEQVRQDLGV